MHKQTQVQNTKKQFKPTLKSIRTTWHPYSQLAGKAVTVAAVDLNSKGHQGHLSDGQGLEDWALGEDKAWLLPFLKRPQGQLTHRTRNLTRAES